MASNPISSTSSTMWRGPGIRAGSNVTEARSVERATVAERIPGVDRSSFSIEETHAPQLGGGKAGGRSAVRGGGGGDRGSGSNGSRHAVNLKGDSVGRDGDDE